MIKIDIDSQYLDINLHSKNRLLTFKRFFSLLKDFLFKIDTRGNPLTVTSAEILVGRRSDPDREK